MITFENGPAHGVTLILQRAPFLLRVTRSNDGVKDHWDALDQLEDTPRIYETIYLYRAKPVAFGMAFFDGTDPVTKRRTGWSSMSGRYEYVPTQPPDEVMRDNEKWLEWCKESIKLKEQADKFMAWKVAQN